MSAAAPFTGGHLNPSVTVAFIKLRKGLDVKTYVISQIVGALIGTTLGIHEIIQHICSSMLFLTSILRTNPLDLWWWMVFHRFLVLLSLFSSFC